jgi:hypothetical protein
MKMRKILAITICILMVFALASCEKEPTLEEKIATAMLATVEDPFAITMSMNYSCDDPNMKATFEAMSGMETKLYVDGTNFAMEMELEGQKLSYTYVDNTLYMDVMGMKISSELTKEQAQEVMGTTVSSVDSLEGFVTVTSEKKDDGSEVITCKGLADETNEFVQSMMSGFGETEGVEVSIDKENFSIVIVIDKEYKYQSVAVEMSIHMDIAGYGEVVVDATTEMKYDFAAGKEITAPADASSYKKIDASDLLG